MGHSSASQSPANSVSSAAAAAAIGGLTVFWTRLVCCFFDDAFLVFDWFLDICLGVGHA
jgi:hypothetical protein